MSLNQACREALKILKQVMEAKLNSTNVEVRYTLALYLLSYLFYQYLKWGLLLVVKPLVGQGHLSGHAHLQFAYIWTLSDTKTGFLAKPRDPWIDRIETDLWTASTKWLKLTY